jgi:hypothetical protein
VEQDNWLPIAAGVFGGNGFQNANGVDASDTLGAVVGVVQTGPAPEPAIWTSPDLEQWQLHVLPGVNAVDSGALDVAVNASSAVAVGHTGAQARFWRMDAGDEWVTGELPSIRAGEGRRSSALAVTATPDGFVAAGSSDTDRSGASLPIIWASSDGTDWEPLPAPSNPSSVVRGISVHRNIVAAVGSLNPGTGVRPIVWLSVGFNEWQSAFLSLDAAPHAVNGQGRLLDVAISSDLIVVVGDGGIWSSRYSASE